MPAFSASPNFKGPLLLPGTPLYLWGSYNDKVSPTSMQISNVALTSNVATLTVQVYSGNIPAVGSLITVTGTQNTSGLFNVTNVALTGVTINATTGAGTVTFALTHANVVSAADAGTAIVPVPVVLEAVPTAGATTGSSIFCALPVVGNGAGLTAIGWDVGFDQAATATVNIQYSYDPNHSDTSFLTSDTLNFSASQFANATESGVAPLFVRFNLGTNDVATKVYGRIFLL